MATILLIGDNELLNRELFHHLVRRQHNVSACRSLSDAMTELRNPKRTYHLVALDMSHNRPADWNAFDHIRKLVYVMATNTRIMCLSTVYWGPQMQLVIERGGARLVYIQ
jgi:ActR/RegA family two-component response regulator